MKVVGAYGIAMAIPAEQILASGLLMAVFLLLAGLTGAVDFIRRITAKAVIRGVQLTTGALLIAGGVRFVLGTSRYQLQQGAVEPYLHVQAVGIIPVSLVIGLVAALLTLLLLDERRFPAGIVVISAGVIVGLFLGARPALETGPALHLPELLPFGIPSRIDFSLALIALVLPQLPMTIGNAVLAYTDLSRDYFGSRSERVTNTAVCVSMALANFVSFLLGGMPLCHGAGGLAAHYRFGARTAGSNIFIGAIFVALALFLGDEVVLFLTLLPMSVLGVLLIFAGVQLTLTIMDLKDRKEFFVATLILGITLASNLAAGFISGVIVARLLKWQRLGI